MHPAVVSFSCPQSQCKQLLPSDFWHAQWKGNGDAKLGKSLPSRTLGYKSIMVSFPPLVGSHSHLYPAGLANFPFLLLGEHILLQCKGRPRQTAGSERAGEPGLARGQLSCMVPEARHPQKSRRMLPWTFLQHSTCYFIKLVLTIHFSKCL